MGALVFHGGGDHLDDPTNPTTTDADGGFQLPGLAPGQTTVTVIAPGWALVREAGPRTLRLSLDEDAAAWQAALKRIHPPWSEGRLAVASLLGISSVPTYWLLDPAGKIVAKGYDPDELVSVLADRLK
jgi:hypothetical protein